MSNSKDQKTPVKVSKPNVFNLLKPYSGMVAFLVVFALVSNGANLLVPKIISRGIDAFTGGHFVFCFWGFSRNGRCTHIAGWFDRWQPLVAARPGIALT